MTNPTNAAALLNYGTTRSAPDKFHMMGNDGQAVCGKGSNKPMLRPVLRGTCGAAEINCSRCAPIAAWKAAQA